MALLSLLIIRSKLESFLRSSAVLITQTLLFLEGIDYNDLAGHLRTGTYEDININTDRIEYSQIKHRRTH